MKINSSVLILIAGLLVGFTMQSCLDLGPNLFNPFDTDEYLYDEHNGGNDKLPSEYDVLPNELTEIIVTSTLNGEDATIYGAYLGDINTISLDTVILYCHGNTGTIDTYYQRAKLLYNTVEKSRYGVLIFDYRGFGKSEGEPSESALIADAHAMTDWLKSMGLTNDRFFIYGFSLGSIPAVALSAEPVNLTPQKLFLEAPIGSIDAMAEDGSGLNISASFFTDLQTDNIELIKSVDQPLYWIHGIADDFLALATHGQPIYDNHSGAYKYAEKVEEGNHGDTPFVMGIEDYVSSVSSFILSK